MPHNPPSTTLEPRVNSPRVRKPVFLGGGAKPQLTARVDKKGRPMATRRLGWLLGLPGRLRSPSTPTPVAEGSHEAHADEADEGGGGGDGFKCQTVKTPRCNRCEGAARRGLL